MQRALLLLGVVAVACCARRAAGPSSVTVSAIDRAPPPDAGAWTAKTVASATTSEPAHLETVVSVLRAAEVGTAIRCTFLEGGQPAGLRFDLSTKQTLWVFGARGVARSAECHEIDADGQRRLRDVARAVGIQEPRDAGAP